ncbi:MAG: phage major capsid protein [Oscillospiraceae bacterium]|jgi:hypothetical protein|nr:phage major capsid protein [Oscillospiraceae bacterium]
MAYDNLQLDKGLYTAQGGFTQALERVDPSANYRGTPLEGLDAYERQLKRFGIRPGGASSDRVEKFFQNSSTAALFPEYVTRAIRQGLERSQALSGVAATTTVIDGTDYRSLLCSPDVGEFAGAAATPEAQALPVRTIRTKEQLVNMKKFGTQLNISYEAVRFHRLDLFTVLLRNMGTELAQLLLGEAVEVLLNGDGNPGTEAVSVAASGGALSYSDLLALWNRFDPFTMTTLFAGSAMAQQVMNLPEMRDAYAGLDFHGTGKLITPLGAELVKTSAMPGGKLLAFDKNAALELVKAGDIVTDFSKLIDCQLESAAVSVTAGFAKLAHGAAVVLE